MIDAAIQAVTVIGIMVLAPLGVGLLQGVDRKLSARMQGRSGPPILQPFFDLLKLSGKEILVVNPLQILFAWLNLLFSVLALLLFVMGQDLIVIIFLTALAGICLVLGGMTSSSPYSQMGSQREILQMTAYEPVLLLLAVACYLVTGSLAIDDVVSLGKPLLLELPLFFLAFFLVVMVKLRKSPFDLAASRMYHQEIVRGVMTEYSGPHLALVELAAMYELALIYGLVGLFWATNLWMGALLIVLVMVGSALVDNVCARMTWQWMLKICWIGGILLAVVNLGLLYI